MYTLNRRYYIERDCFGLRPYFGGLSNCVEIRQLLTSVSDNKYCVFTLESITNGTNTSFKHCNDFGAQVPEYYWDKVIVQSIYYLYYHIVFISPIIQDEP